MILSNDLTYISRIKWVVIGILASLPVLFYFVIVGHFQYDFPFYDDYNVILKTILDWQNATSYQQKISQLIAQHNEHRLVVVRSVALLDYFIRGKIVFTDLIWLGNLSLIVVAAILLRSRGSWVVGHSSFIIPILFLFQFQSWDNQFWAMASIQNFGIYAFVCLSIYFATNQKSYLSLLFAALCISTSGSGIFIVPVILLYYFIDKQWHNLTISGVVLGALCLLYFYHYQPSAQNGSVIGRLFHGNWLEMAVFFGAFLGNNLYHPVLPFVAPIVGWLGAGWVLYLFFKKYKTVNSTLLYILIFILLTALAAALLRSSRGLEGAYPSRYRITSSLFLATLFLTMMQVLETKIKSWVLGLGLVSSLALYTLSIYVYFPRIRNNQELRMADHWFYQNGYNVAGHFDSTFATDILQKSNSIFGLQIQRSAVRDYKFLPTKNVYKVLNLINVSQNVEYGIDWINVSQSAIKGWVRFLKPVTSQKIYVVVNGTVYETLFFKRYDLVAQKKSAAYQDTGFLAILPDTTTISKQNWYLIATNNRGEQIRIDKTEK
jgi:hypothetical protein